MGMPNCEAVVATDDQRLAGSESLSRRDRVHSGLEPGRYPDLPRDDYVPDCVDAFAWRRLLELTREHWGIASPPGAVIDESAAMQHAN
jgi:hypothetical protein